MHGEGAAIAAHIIFIVPAAWFKMHKSFNLADQEPPPFSWFPVALILNSFLPA